MLKIPKTGFVVQNVNFSHLKINNCRGRNLAIILLHALVFVCLVVSAPLTHYRSSFYRPEASVMQGFGNVWTLVNSYNREQALEKKKLF